jgi:hypothetical protein
MPGPPAWREIAGNYFFFLGFLTSFLGPLSLAIVESSLMGDYNRLLRASSAAPKIPRKVSAAHSYTTIGRSTRLRAENVDKRYATREGLALRMPGSRRRWAKVRDDDNSAK